MLKSQVEHRAGFGGAAVWQVNDVKLGVIGHELLIGRRLFKRPSPYETYQAVIAFQRMPGNQSPDSDAAT